MATTEHFYTGNGSTTTYPFTFPYLKNADIKVSLDDVLKTETTHYTVSSTNIVFGSAPGSNVAIRIYRDTDVDTSKATFAAGSSIRATDLNNNETQLLYGAQEQKQLIRTADIDDSQITSAKIKNDTIVNADINTSAAIAGTKVTPAFGSQNVSTTGTVATGALTVTGNIAVSGTVDGRDLAADGSKLDTIAADATGDQTSSEIRLLVEQATDSNVFTDADHSKLNAIEANATADQTNAEIRAAVEAASDSNVFTDADHSKLNAIEAGATADQTAAEIRTLVGSASNSNVYVDTHNALVGGITATASELNILDGVTADKDELNLLDGKSIVTSIAANATDVQIPTAQAVDERITTVVTDIGGFVPIANETSFPATNPDVNDGAGTLVSIKALASNLVSNGSGVATIANGAGSGNTVTINGLANSTTYAAGKGLILETTSTLHTYSFHREALGSADISNAQTLVNDFNERYRIGASNPTSSLDDGDLFFNTTSNKMLVYNDTDSSWDEVQSVGNFYINTISSYSGTGGNSATFNGSAYRFVLSNAPTYAQQLIVSVNGVLQKPNAGTSQPSEGFVIDGSSIIFSSAPPSGADYFIITIGASVNIGAPSDNTVGNAAIIDGAIDNAAVNTNAAIAGSKLADDSIAEVKLDIHNAPSGTDKFLKYTSNGMEWVVPSYTTNTDTQLSTEQVQDIVGAMFSGNTETNITATYEDSDGTIDLVSTDTNTQLTEEQVEDFVGGMVTGNTETGITVTYQDSDGTLDFVVADQTPEGTAILSTGESGGSKYLREDGDGTCSWQSVPAGVGGANGVDFNDNVKARWGTGNDFSIWWDGTHTQLYQTSGLHRVSADGVSFMNVAGTETFATFTQNGSCDLYYDNAKKAETVTGGFTVTGTCTATSFAGDGSALTGVSSSSADGCIWKNTLTISNNHTIAATEGAHSVGPITNNATVTVNGRWVIS